MDNTTSELDLNPTVGLLIVHGIGEQKVGETADKLVRGLSKAYGGRLTVTRGDSGAPVQLDLDQRTVRLYEVHWADILSGERVKGTFRWEVVQALGWFPWLNWKSGLLRSPLYSKRLILAWSVFLIPATLTLYLLYMGARFFAQMANAMLGKDTAPEVQVKGQGRWAKLRATSEAYAAHAREGRTVVEEILDTFAGDVTNYMSSLGRAGIEHDRDELGRASEAILDRFYYALAAAIDDGCGTIQILSHSLGTVISYHGLTGQGLNAIDSAQSRAQSYNPIPKLTQLYTIGSPLEKIRFFWPTTIGEELVGSLAFVDGQARRVVGHGASSCRFRWDNFCHRFDVVSGQLTRFDHWGEVRNHALKGGGGLMRSHVIYEQSPEFLAVITQGLFGEPAPLKELWRHRVRDLVLSTLENLAVPLILGILLIIGLALGLLAALFPGFLFSLPFRALGAYGWVNMIQNTLVVLMLIAIAMTSTFGIKRKARDIHAIWGKSE